MPIASRAVTCTLNAVPAVTVVGGWTVNASCVAPSTVWLHGTDVSPEAPIVNAAGPASGSVARVCASPLASVTTVGVATDAPAGAVNCT